ncbi:fructose permease [Fructilactobacillus sp. Tb1]|uniref:fructose permease n=1 Tax=Fructilactobacillus sp. Tb1 TaxID=3422304 RepID=UPI003D28C793
MTTKTPRTISMRVSIIYFIISLVINSLGNVLTLVTSAKVFPSFLGSAYWTAAETNLSIAFHWNLFWTFVLIGFLVIILNALLLHKWDWGRAIGNLIFMIPFSWLIQVFYDFFNNVVKLPAGRTPGLISLYILINFFGISLIAIAISIYQRVNLVLHPNDDLMQIIRFKYLHGNAKLAMWYSYIPPTIIGIIAILITRRIAFYGIGTIFAFLFQGSITGLADKFVFPKLKHQAIDTTNSGDETIVTKDIDTDINEKNM